MDLDYRELLVKIAREIKREELDTMKFLCANKLPDACLVSGQSTAVYLEALTFFRELEKGEHLSDGNLDLLKRLLVNAERQDLASKLEEFQSQSQNTSFVPVDTVQSVQPTATKSQPSEDSGADNQPKEPAMDKKKAKKKKYREKKKLKNRAAENAALEEVEDKEELNNNQEEPRMNQENDSKSTSLEHQQQQQSQQAERQAPKHENKQKEMLNTKQGNVPKKRMPTGTTSFSKHDKTSLNVTSEIPKQGLPTASSQNTASYSSEVAKEERVDRVSPKNTITKKQSTENRKDLTLAMVRENDSRSTSLEHQQQQQSQQAERLAPKHENKQKEMLNTKQGNVPNKRIPTGTTTSFSKHDKTSANVTGGIPKQGLPAASGQNTASYSSEVAKKERIDRVFPKNTITNKHSTENLKDRTQAMGRENDSRSTSLEHQQQQQSQQAERLAPKHENKQKEMLNTKQGNVPNKRLPTGTTTSFSKHDKTSVNVTGGIPKQGLPAASGQNTASYSSEVAKEERVDHVFSKNAVTKKHSTENLKDRTQAMGRENDSKSTSLEHQQQRQSQQAERQAPKHENKHKEMLNTKQGNVPKKRMPTGTTSFSKHDKTSLNETGGIPKQGLPAASGQNTASYSSEVAKEGRVDHVLSKNAVTREESTDLTAAISSPLHPLCVLVVCNKWQSWGESIPVINRELCLALARAGHQVACLVLTATDTEREEARNGNVELIKCSQTPGINNDDPQRLQFHDSQTLSFTTPDLVVGHGKATGSTAMFYANKISCPRLHVIHDLPDECLKYDEVIGKQVNEEELAKCADFVAAVGTLLHEKWSVILNRDDVIEIIPGLPDLNTRNRISSPQSRYFVPAKFSSPWSSGLDLAVMAVNKTSGRDTLPRKATLMPRNTEYKGSGKSTKKILKNCDKKRVELNLNERQEIQSQQTLIDLQGATMFLSPARSEAFGVSALDAIAIGIPIVICSRSGLACTIRKYFDEKFHSCIKDVSSECSGNADDDDGDQDAMVWAIPLDKASLYHDEVFSQAEELRSEWKSKFTWDKAVQLLGNTISKSSKLSSASSRNLTSSTSLKRLPDSIVSLVKDLNLFDKRQKFVLFLSPTQDCPPETVHLGLVHWATVFDFDRDSQKSGYLKTCDKFLQNIGKPACRLPPPPKEDAGKQKQSVALPGGGIPWILTQGLPDMARDIDANLDWILEIFQQIKKRYPCPITFLILWKTTEANKSLCKKLYKVLNVAQASPFWKNATQVELLSLSDDIDSRLEDIAEECAIEIKQVNLSEFCRAIYSIAIENPLYELDTDFSLPKLKSDGSTTSVVPQVLPSSDRWVDSVLEPLYTSVGDTPEFGQDDAYHFYRGGKISWYAIEMNYAVERESWDPLRKAIESELEYSGAASLTLFHQRGTGGTTSARKLLYDFHRRYPCVCLKNINYETYLAIKVIWNFCSLPVLILADLKDVPGADINDIEALYGNLSSDKISCLILHVVHRQNYTRQDENSQERDSTRRIGQRSTDTSQKKPLVLAKTLTQKERQTFCEVYSSHSQSNKQDLDNLRSNTEEELQIPFYYGLVAFGKEFKGLEPFVRDCLEGLDVAQQKAMCFLSMAHYYAQKPIPASALAGVFRLKPRQLHSMSGVLPLNATELLIEDEAGCCRPRHDTIGKEIICQLLTAPFGISKKNWKRHLADKVVEFITFMEEDLTTAILLNRISDEHTFQQFSSLVEHIPYKNDVIRVFSEAIKIHPANPFFNVHLGRYYSVTLEIDGFDEACKYTDDGILLASDFSSRNVRSQLTQMKGIVYKRQVKNKIERKAPLEEIIPLAEEGVKAFTRAVSISTEHLEDVFIPQVRMMYDIFKYINRTVEGGIFGYLHSQTADPFIKNGISETSDVLESVADSIYYPVLRRNMFNLGGGKKTENKENLIEHFKKLKKTFKTSTASINREIVLIELEVCKEKNRPVSEIAEALMKLLEEALKYDANINLTMRLWVKVAPYIPVPLMDAESKITTWSYKGKSAMSYLYRHIFTCIRILEGGRDPQFEDNRWMARDDLYKAVTGATRHLIKHPDRPVVFLGNEKGMAQLVIPEESIKDVRKHRTIPEDYGKKLRRLTGTITKLTGKLGDIRSQGLNISFRADLCQPPLVGPSYVAKKVKFYLAFTYFGLDAYNVKIMAD